MTDRKPSRHRFPLSVIGNALWLDQRFPLSQRDVQEQLHEHGIQVSHETLRQWNMGFAPLLTEELRQRELRRSLLVASGRGVRPGRWGGALVVAGGHVQDLRL